MKRIHIILFLLIGFSSSVFAQADKWEIYQAYQNTEQVEETNNHVFAVADSSLYAYSKEDNSLTTYSRKNGLSDNKIKVLRYHASSHTLIIAYRNGNIDLFGNDGIYNLPYLKNNTSVQNKTINDVYLYQDYAYISAEVGILVVNLNKKEITDTYRIGSVRSACILNGNLYALTGEGIRYGKLTDNLLDQSNWNNLTLHTTDFETNQIRRIADFDNRLCLAVSNLGIYYLNNNALTRLLHNTSLSNMKVENGKLLSFSASYAKYIFLKESLSIKVGMNKSIIPPLFLKALISVKISLRFTVAGTLTSINMSLKRAYCSCWVMIRSGDGMPSVITLRQSEWIVENVTPVLLYCFANRFFISIAAASVNVTIRICSAGTPLSSMWSMRRSIVVVFPDPGQLIKRTCPFMVLIACS